MSALAALAVLSGLSLNLMLQLGIGIEDFGNDPDRSARFVFFQWAALFFSVLILWCLFSYILSPLSLGFFEYFLLLPLTAGAGKGFEALFLRVFPDEAKKPGVFSGGNSIGTSSDTGAYNGLTITALVLTLRLAGSFAAALVLSLGFSLGVLFSIFILRAINRRSSLETVPKTMRGIPLTLISMGLLCLIFSALSVILLRVLAGK
jgi:electron transport complex protein RnfA